jgi:hypothetical protein
MKVTINLHKSIVPAEESKLDAKNVRTREQIHVVDTFVGTVDSVDSSIQVGVTTNSIVGVGEKIKRNAKNE